MGFKIVQRGYNETKNTDETREVRRGWFDGRNISHPEFHNANAFAREFFEYTFFVIEIREDGSLEVKYGTDPSWMKDELGMDTDFWLRIVRESIESSITTGRDVEVSAIVDDDDDDDDDDDSDYIEWSEEELLIKAA